jgi:hypothetical protein
MIDNLKINSNISEIYWNDFIDKEAYRFHELEALKKALLMKTVEVVDDTLLIDGKKVKFETETECCATANYNVHVLKQGLITDVIITDTETNEYGTERIVEVKLLCETGALLGIEAYGEHNGYYISVINLVLGKDVYNLVDI